MKGHQTPVTDLSKYFGHVTIADNHAGRADASYTLLSIEIGFRALDKIHEKHLDSNAKVNND